jgi:hypothetical protein
MPGVSLQRFAGRADAAEWMAAEQDALPEVLRSLGDQPRGEAFRRQLASALERCVTTR